MKQNDATKKKSVTASPLSAPCFLFTFSHHVLNSTHHHALKSSAQYQWCKVCKMVKMVTPFIKRLFQLLSADWFAYIIGNPQAIETKQNICAIEGLGIENTSQWENWPPISGARHQQRWNTAIKSTQRAICCVQRTKKWTVPSARWGASGQNKPEDSQLREPPNELRLLF